MKRTIRPSKFYRRMFRTNNLSELEFKFKPSEFREITGGNAIIFATHFKVPIKNARAFRAKINANIQSITGIVNFNVDAVKHHSGLIPKDVPTYYDIPLKLGENKEITFRMTFQNPENFWSGNPQEPTIHLKQIE